MRAKERDRFHGRQLRALLAQELADRWRSLVIWGLALGVLGILYVALYPSMSKFMEEYLEQAPESMRRLLGELQGPITAEKWLEMEFLSTLLPVALPLMVIILGARTVAGREERKAMDLLLCNPVPRWHLVAASTLAMAMTTAGVLGITWILTYAAVPIVGVELSAGRLAMALAAVWPLCLVFGTLALALSAVVRRSSLAIAIPVVILIAMYVIQALSQVSKTMEKVRFLSLLYHLGHPIGGDFPWTATLLMLLAVCVLVTAAGIAFERRDIYT